MKTSIIKREIENIEIGDLIITYKDEIEQYIAIYRGINIFGDKKQYHTFSPVHSFSPPMQHYRGILKKELVTNNRFKIQKFTDILKIEPSDSNEYTNTLLLIKDIDQNHLYYALCEWLGDIMVKIIPIKMIAKTKNIVGTQVWVDPELCSVYKGTIKLSN